MTTKTATFILGAHRSGTSATTRLLNLLGVDLGRIPIQSAADNAKGFWEHPDVVALNEAVLALLGSRWDDASPLPPAWWSAAAMSPQRDAIRRLVKEEFADAVVFGMKDPRLCRLLPLWLVALESLPIVPVFVLVLRHPCEVAASIQNRNRLPQHTGQALWLTHMLDAERYTRGHRRAFVSYEALLADWRAQARRIAAAAGLSWARSEDEVEVEVERFLDPALRHFTASRPEGRPDLTPWVARAYRLMAAASRGETPEIRSDLASLNEAFAAAQDVFGPLLADAQAGARRARRAVEELAASARAVTPRYEAVRVLEFELAEQTAWAQATVADVVKRDHTIRELQASLKNVTGWAKRSAQDVAARDATIGELRVALEAQTRWAQESANGVARRDAIIGELQAALDGQMQWAQESAKGVARRDAIIGELQLALDRQTESAGVSAARVAEQEAIVRQLNRRPREDRRGRSIFDGAGHAARWRRLHDAVNGLVKRAATLATRARGPVVRVRRALATRRSVRPRIDTLFPAWTEVGRGFNQHGGRACLGAQGHGFSRDAILVIGGFPAETLPASDTLLTAFVPDAVFARAGVVAIWVDNRGGGLSLSPIYRFRVMSKRTVAAHHPASGRWRHLRDAGNGCLRLIAGAWSRLQLPRLYLQRALGRRARRGPPAAPPLPDRDAAIVTPEMLAAHLAPARWPRRPDIVCFPIIDWDFRYQRPQQILTRLVEAGHRVFYLSQRFLGPADETFRLRPLVPGVTEVFLQASSALNIYTDPLEGEVEDRLYASLLTFMGAAELAETICVVHLPFWTPLALRLRADLGSRIVFDCLDDFSGFQNIGNRMAALEQLLATRAHLVVASSRVLADKHRAQEPLLVPNAADYTHFAAARMPASGRSRRGHAALARGVGIAARWLARRAPVLGYYGAMAHWFDTDLVARAAAARPDWQFVLIGRTDPEVRVRLASVPNVRLLGEQPYEVLPSHLAAFDVCLIPFVVGDLIKATSPVKFFEYLAAGKPVVAARMPELLPFSGECFLYEDLPEFLRQVERALREKDDPARIEARQVVAKANTWQARVAILSRALDELYPRASVIVATSDSGERTRACVESLLDKTAYADWELIVVDTHRADETPADLASVSERCCLVQIGSSASTSSVAAAHDQGIRQATGEFVVLLDDGAAVTHGWLGRLLRHLDDPGIGLRYELGPFVADDLARSVEARDHPGVAAEDVRIPLRLVPVEALRRERF